LNNQWNWTLDEPVEYPEPFFLTSMHDYMLMVYDTGNDALLKHMISIAENVLQAYPKHVLSLTDLGIAHVLLKQGEQGLAPLQKAEKLDPENDIVLSNLARCYALLGQNKEAIAYFEKAKTFGDEYMAEYCDEQIALLKSED